MKKTEYTQPELQVMELHFEDNLLKSGNGSGQNMGEPETPEGPYSNYFN